MLHLTLSALLAFPIDLQLFATTGTTVEANPGAPRRNGTRDPIGYPIDLAVTPTGGSKVNQAGGIMANEMVYLVGGAGTAAGVAGLTTTGSSNANAAYMVGVSNGEYPPLLSDSIYAPDPTSSPVGSTPYIEVWEEGDFLFNTTAAQSYDILTTVYLGADGRTVSTTPTGTKVGYVSPDQRGIGGVGIGQYSAVPPSFPIAGASGVLVYVRIQPALTNPNG